MAANMQQMAGPGQMVSQQLRRSQAPLQLQQIVYQNLAANSQTPPNSLTWQASVGFNDRMGKTMELYVPQNTIGFRPLSLSLLEYV